MKKYHHRPGFGVRSGSRKLAPHVLVVQPSPPTTTVEASVKTAEYPANSATDETVRLQSPENGFGDARCEWGLLDSKSRVEGSNSTAESESCEAAARASNDGDMLCSAAYLRDSRTKALSKVDVADAREGKKT